MFSRTFLVLAASRGSAPAQKIPLGSLAPKMSRTVVDETRLYDVSLHWIMRGWENFYGDLSGLGLYLKEETRKVPTLVIARKISG